MRSRGFPVIRPLCSAAVYAAGLAVEGPACAETHYIFVTSSAYDGNLGGLPGADALCDVHAANGSLTAPLNRNWTALLSVAGVVDAKDRIIWSGPLYDITGLLVTNDPGTWPWNSAGSSSLGRDENGDFSAPSYVWTGTTSLGVAKGADYDCNDWTAGSSSANGWSGETGAFPDSYWIDSFGNSCGDPFFALYCVSVVVQDTIFASDFEGASSNGVSSNGVRDDI